MQQYNSNNGSTLSACEGKRLVCYKYSYSTIATFLFVLFIAYNMWYKTFIYSTSKRMSSKFYLYKIRVYFSSKQSPGDLFVQ